MFISSQMTYVQCSGVNFMGWWMMMERDMPRHIFCHATQYIYWILLRWSSGVTGKAGSGHLFRVLLPHCFKLLVLCQWNDMYLRPISNLKIGLHDIWWCLLYIMMINIIVIYFIEFFLKVLCLASIYITHNFTIATDAEFAIFFQ